MADRESVIKICGCLHDFFNKLPRFRFPFDKQSLPLNGIYVLFEKGERGHCLDRIVRVGSHTGQNNLRERMREHFIRENKDRSIFRKNIGRALLNTRNDPYLSQWNYDLTSKKNRVRYEHEIDWKFQQSVESEVSEIIKDTFSFSVIHIDNREARMKYEKKMIATIGKCSKCEASDNWFGKNSPENRIRQSGLWLKQGLRQAPFSLDEFSQFIQKVKV
ncbi:hypothetical protein [Sedimentisphaera salicampi]|uniref:GIY-YIG domain-containing protein n=1 Tax=Sedimentisphaera salicampi TaxID=1941349 RepID=A0A1W6LPZ8_9BACT|nr:hypothetical protein [Sedimentisphaera salicampi]ARN57875.1 hypothetical protein STSP1_02301 [Sedimentisphaera salicampi]